jgi:Mg-chelatase subunit ChlD
MINNLLAQKNIITPVAVKSAAKTTSLGEAFKPKQAGQTKSHIIFVLDDSGSMQSCRDQTIQGFNEYLKGQQTDAVTTGIATSVSLYKFDGWNVNCVYDHVAVADAALLDRESYNPQGGTNLLDAMGGVMMKINEQLSANKKKDRESVIITILTDGAENQSRSFRNEDIKAMVEKAEGKNWGFMFLGANINAFAAGSAMGFNTNNTMQFNTSNAAETIRSASAMTSRMKSAYSTGAFRGAEGTTALYSATAFTEQERNLAVGKDD